MSETVGMVLDRLEQKAAMALELPPNGTSLDLLRLVYRNPAIPLPVRLRAALGAIQHEHARLAVVAQVTDQGLAELLDRRLKKLRDMEQNGKMIEAQPQEVETKPMLPRSNVEVRPPLAPTNDRRFRRF